MTDTKIYTALLRLQHPWYISHIDLDVKAEEAHVFISHHHEQMPCPTCGEKCNVREHGDERMWRHMDLWQAKSYLHAAMPRTDCHRLPQARGTDGSCPLGRTALAIHDGI